MQKISQTNRLHAVELLRRALPEDARILAPERSTDEEIVEITVHGAPRILVHLVPAETEDSFDLDRDCLPVSVFRRRTPKERDDLRRAGRSFLDLSGAVYLRSPGFYLDRTGLAAPRRRGASRRKADPYNDTASRVVRVLLTTPRSHRWTTQGLAAEAEVDVSTASRVVRELRRRELARDEAPGQGRRSQIWVPDHEALLEDWTRSYSWRDNLQVRVAAPIGSPRRFLARMPELFAGERWAVTLHAGASLVSPHAEFDVVHLYVIDDEPLEATAMKKGWEITPSGKLSLLAPLYDKSVWFKQNMVEGIPVVSPIQLVLDLWHYPVRGREQARHLVETGLRPIWESDVERE